MRLSELADLLEQDAMPDWVHREFNHRLQEIAANIQGGRCTVLNGPDGLSITIHSLTGKHRCIEADELRPKQ